MNDFPFVDLQTNISIVHINLLLFMTSMLGAFSICALYYAVCMSVLMRNIEFVIVLML